MQTGSTKIGVAAVLAALAVAVGAGQASADAAGPAVYRNGYLPLGNPNASVVVAVTEDFACPACKEFESLSGSTLAKIVGDGRVAVRYRPIALIDRNWAAVTHTDYSARSANAAACVAQADPAKFLAFHNALFAAQPAEGTPGPSDAQLVNTAAQTGSTSPDTAVCILTERYKPYVEATTNTALNQIQGTPTVTVNGTPVDDPVPTNILAAIAKAEGH
jgi:protein-disulfide isomerase